MNVSIKKCLTCGCDKLAFAKGRQVRPTSDDCQSCASKKRHKRGKDKRTGAIITTLHSHALQRKGLIILYRSKGDALHHVLSIDEVLCAKPDKVLVKARRANEEPSVKRLKPAKIVLQNVFFA